MFLFVGNPIEHYGYRDMVSPLAPENPILTFKGAHMSETRSGVISDDGFFGGVGAVGVVRASSIGIGFL